YVTMYGLPSQGDIDPTWFVALTYSLFFGIMFGDLGQGIVVALVGYILQKYKKMPLGGILMRAGLFSGIFGCIYGSVFGFEHLLDPVYHAIGLASKPLEVFESINLILISSVVLGAFIVLCAIIFGVVSKFKRGKIGEAIFSPNGISGLVFYVSILIMAADMLLLHIGIVSTPFIIIGLVIPFICMYMCEPLERLVDTGKWHLENGIGDLLMSGFFEMFDTLLSYVTNTLSFLRIGGFVLCHAGMMSVVFTLAAMAGAAYWPVVVIGNIFVMCLEGLIVGIQALRLEFYEIFSRFFEADAVAFNPLRLQAHE
ncbi:MAG: ATPase, partial [Oscillospiraceae bacterium]